MAKLNVPRDLAVALVIGLGCGDSGSDSTTSGETGSTTGETTGTTGEPTHCTNGMLDGDETDVDCGGATCDRCGQGGSCSNGTDCVSGFCSEDVCVEKNCDVDGDCTRLDGPCVLGICDQATFECTTFPISEGAECDDGDGCTMNTRCDSGVCEPGNFVDCSALDGPCGVGVCDPADGSCNTMPVREGTPCDDGMACTGSEVCTAGVCMDADGEDIFIDEDFSDDLGGWTLGNTWEIGPAMASPPGEAGTGSDPDQDHTATMDNGIAGVLIGGLTQGSIQWTYLESPSVDTSGIAVPIQLQLFRWLNADVNAVMPSTIEVWDGTDWVTLFENGDMVTVGAEWTEEVFDVSAHANADFRVRVGFRAQGNAASVGGWNIDDVLLAPEGCTP